MSYITGERTELIYQLERLCRSSVICYLTSDRRPFGAQIALDVLPLFYGHLKQLGRTGKISLFLESNGGVLDAPWPLVGLVREFCDEFEVLVPSRALSAATLIALGADSIVMGPASYLSPVDPHGTIGAGDEKRDFAVEDVVGFIDFAREQVGLRGEEALTSALLQLTHEVSPTELGSVHRAYHLIRRLAKRLLALHLNPQREEHRIEFIANSLIQGLYSHTHLIYRSEAREALGFGDLIESAAPDVQEAMDTLLEQYREILGLGTQFNPYEHFEAAEEQSAAPKQITIARAIVESRTMCHVFETTLRLRVTDEGVIEVAEQTTGWKEETSNGG